MAYYLVHTTKSNTYLQLQDVLTQSCKADAVSLLQSYQKVCTIKLTFI